MFAAAATNHDSRWPDEQTLCHVGRACRAHRTPYFPFLVYVSYMVIGGKGPH